MSEYSTDASGTRRARTRGTLLVVLSAIIWSLGGLLVRLIEADEWTTIFWRSLFATLTLVSCFPIVLGRNARFLAAFRALGWPGLLVAMCLSLDTILFIFALERTTIANAAVIFAISPFVAALLAWVLLREVLPRRTGIAAVVCLASVVIMMSGSFGGAGLTGDLLALSVVFVFSIATVTIRRYPRVEMYPAILVAAALTALVTLPFAQLTGISAREFGLLGVFGVAEFALATVLFSVGARYLPAAQSLLLSMLETVLSPLWVWIVINEQPAKLTLAGGTVILIAVAVHTLREHQAEIPAPPMP